MIEPDRWPLAPLLDASGLGAGAFGEVIGLDDAAVSRLARHGLTERTADRLAVAVGLHPGNVWPRWFDVDDVG